MALQYQGPASGPQSKATQGWDVETLLSAHLGVDKLPGVPCAFTCPPQALHC